MQLKRTGMRRVYKRSIFKEMIHSWQLYVLILPMLVYFVIFHYMPMYGVQIAFRNYKITVGITASEWVGLKHFKEFFSAYYFTRLIMNTLLLNVYALVLSFPAPIILALVINQLHSARFKRFAQTVVYVPHFISTVVLAGMLYMLLSPTTGLVNKAIEAIDGKAIYFMVEPGWFRALFISSSIWQNAGWSSILYIAALTSIDKQLYEAAKLDGASRLQCIRYIEFPHLIPVATMMLILSCGTLMSSATDRVLLMQTPGNLQTSDILGTYVYSLGVEGGQFSYTAAIGLFANIVNFVLIVSTNTISKRLGGERLF